jgi:hypothetical protein
MGAPRPLEQQLLELVTARLDEAAGIDHATRLDVLEAVSSLLGGFSLERYRATDDHARVLSLEAALAVAETVLPELRAAPVPAALALTSLARPPMVRAEQRRAGAYYTDFRLARFLARGLIRTHRPGDRVIDPASGTGVLLAAAALELGGGQEAVDRFVAESVHAADLSAEALRGVKLALASLTASDHAIAAMAARLREIDSLAAGPAAWADVAALGFQTVIGNPPWEKLKVSRHEHLAAQGVERHYGTEYGTLDHEALAEARSRMAAYASEMSALYAVEGGGDPDLYKLFLALAVNLAADDGQVAILVPAGLIRSQGTGALRRYLLDHSGRLRLTVLDNKARFFAIDTRFKFLSVQATLDRADIERAALALEHGAGTPNCVEVIGSAEIERAELERLRPDLTVPEVRSTSEWRLFRKMAESTPRLGELADEWPMDIVREIDMTNDRDLLSRHEPPGRLPLVEGRMVHQFRSTHKAYVSGSGRSARWRVTDVGHGELVPQFWVDPDDLSPALLRRIAMERVGFCDITGQTNERAMLAARIPAGAACGNKVPTITFAAHAKPRDAADLWLAVVNSFAFDWLLRRLVTTTVNYFVLRGVPFPRVTVESARGRRLIELARLVEAAYRDADASGGPRRLAEWRAEMDALVLRAYGLDLDDAQLVLQDFPLLDRGQLPLPDEPRSTVTRHIVLDAFGRLVGDARAETRERLAAALLLEATPYVPAQGATTAKQTACS